MSKDTTLTYSQMVQALQEAGIIWYPKKSTNYASLIRAAQRKDRAERLRCEQEIAKALGQ